METVNSLVEQGLDPDLVAELYYNASQLETIYSLLVADFVAALPLEE